MDQLTDFLEQSLDNPYVASSFTLFLVLFGALARPDLPDVVIDLFDHPLFKMVVLFLIAFTASRNTQVALIVTLVFLSMSRLVTEKKMAEGFMAYHA